MKKKSMILVFGEKNQGFKGFFFFFLLNIKVAEYCTT